MKYLALSVALAGAISGGFVQASLAQDWSGFYAGVLAGYGSGELKGATPAGAFASTTSFSGALLGGALGANYQTGSFVVGVEGDVAWSGMTGSKACVGAPAQTCSIDVHWMSTLRARAGYTIDDLMVFATAGLSMANGTAKTSPASGGTTGSDTQTFVGWAAGLGAEYMVAENVSLKLDYLYSDWGSRTSPINTVAAGSAYVGSPTSHAVRVGLNYRF